MSQERIEDKLELIANEVIGLNYDLAQFEEYLLQKQASSSLEKFVTEESYLTLNQIIEGFKGERTPSKVSNGAARFTEDILKSVDLVKYPLFAQHELLRETNTESQSQIQTKASDPTEFELPKPSEESKQEEESHAKDNSNQNPEDLENNDAAEQDEFHKMKTADGISSIDGMSSKEDGQEDNFGNSFDQEMEGVSEPIGEQQAQVQQAQELQAHIQKKPKDDSAEISADHIELSVSQIKTENLQWMKEKPLITLVK